MMPLDELLRIKGLTQDWDKGNYKYVYLRRMENCIAMTREYLGYLPSRTKNMQNLKERLRILFFRI